MDRLSEIRARCDAATPGPWKAVETKVAGWEGKHGVKSESGWDIVPCQCDWEGFGYGASDPDAAFIANSREDIPYLLEEIERLKAENKRLDIEDAKDALRGDTLRGELQKMTARVEKAEAERDKANKCIYDTETYFDLGANKFAYRTIKQYTHDVMEAKCTES